MGTQVFFKMLRNRSYDMYVTIYQGTIWKWESNWIQNTEFTIYVHLFYVQFWTKIFKIFHFAKIKNTIILADGEIFTEAINYWHCKDLVALAYIGYENIHLLFFNITAWGPCSISSDGVETEQLKFTWQTVYFHAIIEMYKFLVQVFVIFCKMTKNADLGSGKRLLK